MGDSFLDEVKGSMKSDTEEVLGILFPTKNRFMQLQMTTKLQPRAVMAWSVLGVFRRKFGSRVLRDFQEEHNMNRIAENAAGRAEAIEVIVGLKRAAAKDQEAPY